MKDDPQYRQLMQKSQGRLESIQHQDNDDNHTQYTRNNKLEEQRGHVRKAIHAVKQQMNQTMYSMSSQLDQCMLQMMVSAMDVAEFYSPPRIAKMASNMGLRAGWSMDLTTQDSDGRPWDFNIP